MAKSSATKRGAVSALDYLSAPAKYPAKGICTMYGDDAYLKWEALAALRREVLGATDDGFSLSTFAGRDAQLRDVMDALSMASLFGGGRRLIIVEDADPFVTQYRGELEEYVARPARDTVLALDVKTWPGNTRLAKAVAATGLAIDCAAPKERPLKTWLIKWAKTKHRVGMDAAAADLLFELVPAEPGILVQEVAKLALVVGQDRVVDAKLVGDNVGGWRARTTWEMIDAAADGRADTALAQLDRLISSGEKPHGLLPQMASSLRRFATAIQLIETAETEKRRLPLRDALSQAGVLPFRLSDTERQLRQIGRHRARQLTSWLLAADLAIKGHNSSDDRARTELERLIVRLSVESREQEAANKSLLTAS